jgi:hypothetical protein
MILLVVWAASRTILNHDGRFANTMDCPDVLQSILSRLLFRSGFAALLRTLSPILDVGRVNGVSLFSHGSNCVFVHGLASAHTSVVELCDLSV